MLVCIWQNCEIRIFAQFDRARHKRCKTFTNIGSLTHFGPGMLATEISAQSLRIFLHILRGQHKKWQKHWYGQFWLHSTCHLWLVLGCMCHQLWPPGTTAVTGQLQLPHHCRCPTSVVDRCKCDYKCIFEPFQCNPIASCQSFVQEEESCHRPKQLFSFQLSASHNIKIRS